MKKGRLSAEEALSLILDATDQETDSESDSDVDILSMDAPHPPGPQAVKVSSPCTPQDFNNGHQNAVYENLQPISIDSAHFCTCSSSEESLCTCSTHQSSPTLSPASSPSPPKLTRPKKTKPVKSTLRKRKIPEKHSSRIPVRVPSAPRELTISSHNLPADEQTSRIPVAQPSSRQVITISSSSDISDIEHSSQTSSPSSSPPYPSSSSEDGSRFLPLEHFPNPPKMGEDAQKDIDEMNVSLDNFDFADTITCTCTRPNFLISKIPFMIMCMYIKRYLVSIQMDPSKPEWPVPGIDKNQKRHFRRKVERYTVKKGILYYLHKFSDKTIGYERGIFHIIHVFHFSRIIVVTVLISHFRIQLFVEFIH